MIGEIQRDVTIHLSISEVIAFFMLYGTCTPISYSVDSKLPTLMEHKKIHHSLINVT
jgi:hypothetical protein